MKNNKITAHPPQRKSSQDFILEAESKNKVESRAEKIILPWEESGVRHDVQKVFTVKLPEEYILKIRFVSEQTNKSQQKIVREIICSEIDELLKEMF